MIKWSNYANNFIPDWVYKEAHYHLEQMPFYPGLTTIVW